MTPQALLTHHDQARLWPAVSAVDPATTMDDAYKTALAVRALRTARGEFARGFKVGFTNRNLWPRYQVYQPIWGSLWNTTVQYAEGADHLPLSRLCQPRIEPEAVFGFKTDLTAADTPCSLAQIFEALEWVAPGFEIVHSHMPDWKFSAAQAVADSGLHGRLLVGSRVPVRSLAGDAEAFSQLLANTRVALHRNGQRVEEGTGANVLDSPLLALLHFVQTLHACPGAPSLKAGDVVTTGTWTDAWPVHAREHWSARFSQALPALDLSFR